MLQTIIPPPVYALGFAGLMWSLDRYVPLAHWLVSPWNRIGLVLVAGAVLADVWSLGLFFKARTTPNPMKPDRVSQLVVDGLYRYTRNPMYVGMLVMLGGWWLYLGSVMPVLMLPLFVWVLNKQQILPEEAVLEAKFGQAYREYCQRVPRWLW